MDEDTWDRLAPWRVTPMWCKLTKSQINEAVDQWEDRRNRRKRVQPSASTEHGYKAGFKRKIGFGR